MVCELRRKKKIVLVFDGMGLFSEYFSLEAYAE